jgi:hypothetical protein
MVAPPRFMLLGQRPARRSVRSQAFVLSGFFRRKKRMQIISLQDGTQLAKWNNDQKWNSDQIAASAWPLKA